MKRTLLAFAAVLPLAVMAETVFPLKVSENRRYLVDPNGAPYLLHGDTAWSLLVALNQEETERYLEDRKQRGFTAIIVNLIEHKFVAHPPNNRNGDGPFLTPGDFSTPNEAYFRHADWVIERAEEKGIAVLLFPCYLGYGGGDEGFWKELNANGAEKSREYGRFLGARYQRFSNIIWVHGGDYSPPDDHPGVGFALEILMGIKERDPAKLHSFHGVRSTTSLEHARFAPHLQLNAVYTGDELSRGKATPDEPYKMSLQAFNRNDFKPTFLIEARYENLSGSAIGGLHSNQRHRFRRQAYWAILSGTTGHFFGNEPVWNFRPGWDGPAGIRSPGNQDMTHLRQVFTSRAWHALVPDQDHTTVTAGYGSFGQTDYVTAGRVADGSLVMVYVPPTGTEARALTVDLSRLSGDLGARWFNPGNGSYAVIPGSPFTNSGPRDFTTPGDNGTGQNDWVLVLESQSSQPRVTKTPSPLQFERHTVDAAGPANPWIKIAGDLNGDGRDDLIVGGQKGPLVWYRSPDFKKYTIADSGWSTVSGAVGDVDGDGDLDVLLGGSVWFENPGNLRAAPGQPWKLHQIAEDPTHDIATADFNGDGRLDAVTRNQSEFGAKSGNRIRIWLQQTNGPWQGAELECPQGEGLAVADLDRDGAPDIVIGGTWFETIRESGQVRWQAHGFAEFHRNATVAVADFNADGRPDVALAPSELAGQNSRLSWFEAPENPRVGSWREHRLADPIEAVVHSLAAADFDRNGRMDLAFAEMHQGGDPDEVGILLNHGAGHPWEKVVVSTTGSHGLQILDVDGDGAPGLFGANWSGPRPMVELWRQRPRSTAEAGRDGTAFAGLPRLRVSENRRFLVTADGQPFFWLADTAWWIRQLPPPLVKHYLSTRTQQGFNLIQVHGGFAVTNHAGASPFLNNAPESPNELFWRELDRVVAEARAHRLYVALVPMWGDEYGRAFGTNAVRAFAFGQWIGRRYASESHVVWIVSGEYDAINGFKLPINAAQKNLLIAVARGLRDAHGGTQLMTIHPGVARTSSTDFHQEGWLDFNLLQSGHLIDSTARGMAENHTLIANDYARQPIKPVLDGEPIYEDTPDAVWSVKHIDGPRAGADAVRRKAYWSVFSGACGHTYGHNDVYGFFTPAFPGQVLSLKTRPSGPGQRGDWRDALPAPGATQMQHLRRLIESRPFHTQVPDRSLLATPETSPLEYLAVLRGEGYALVYSPNGRPVRVRLNKLSSREVQAWWFDPRTGKSQAAGRFAREGEREFTPPGQPRAGNDWVLALDDPARRLPAPGSARLEP